MTARPAGAATRTQVLIAGAGPSGLFAAVELALRGVDCLVVEPRPEVTRARPRAKTLNTRTLEHLRRVGLAGRVRALAPLPPSWSSDIAFRTTLLDEDIARFHGVLGLVDDDDLSPELGQQLPQYVLEELLRQVVQELPHSSLSVGARVDDLQPGPSDVGVTLRQTDGTTAQVTAEYVIGADGPGSAVRRLIGAAYVGAPVARPNLSVVFRTPDLDDVLADRPAVQYWLLNDQTPGMMGPLDRDGTWWLIAFGVDASNGAVDLPALLAGATGKPIAAEMLSTDPWTARMELVDRSRAGRVFLIGDAAHLNPPFGGHGLNTGLGDAVDLAWKLAARLQGWGGEALLDSHVHERRPLHEHVIAAAAANNAVLAGDLATTTTTSSSSSAENARDALAARIRATKAAEYYSLDLVLGHRYVGSPVVRDGDGPSVEVPGRPWATTIRAGARLPHVWLRPGRSTLDTVGWHFTLLLLAQSDPAPLTEAAAQLGLPLDVVDLQEHDLGGRFGAALALVRPDQHVAWYGMQAPRDALALLRQAAGLQPADKSARTA